MTIKLQKTLADFPSACEIIETDSFRACSFAMDDGGRCLLDVISDPLLLQSFLESGSDDNSKDPQDGTSSESAVESPQVTRYPHVSLSNHVASSENVIEPSDQQMGYSYPGDGQGLLAHNSIGMSLGSGTALIVGSSSSATLTYQHASSSRTTIHLSTSAAQPSVLQHPPVPPRPHTPISYNNRSPGQGSPVVHMPPPSPLQQTRSPLTSHTPSPAPAWSPVPPVLSPATSRVQSSMPSIAFQQPHNQVLQTTANVTQIVTAFSQQNQKVSMQQQQPPLLLHPQTSPIPSPQQPTRISMTTPVVTTASVPVTPSMVQIIPAPQANVPLPVRTAHSTVRPIQPKLPQQILPKPASSAANQFVAPVVKPASSTPVTASQRGVGVPLQTAATSQLVIGQGQPGMFSGPQGTIVLNSIIPGVGQSPILIQGNLGNLANLQGLQLTLRPPVSATSSQSLTSGAQSNPTLIAALQSPNQPAQALFTQTKSPLHGQQTIVIPNNIAPSGLAPQNLNLTPTAIRNSTIVPSVSQGQGFLARSNIILSSRVVGPNQGLQLQQIQTPQGPILALASSGTIALPHLPTALQNATLGNPQLTSGTVPLQSVVAAGQSVISGLPLQSQHATLHQHSQHQPQSLFSATVPIPGQMEHSSQPVVHLPQTVPAQHIAASLPASQSPALQLQSHSQQDNPSPKPPSPPKPSKVPSVNLEELLKEHGIVPENTPPPSPGSQSPPSEDAVPTQLQVHSPVVQSPQLIAALQSQHHVVLEHLSQNPLPTSPLPQVKLALAQDGSVIIQPHAFIPARFSHSPSQTKISSSVSSSALPSVTSAVSVPVVTTQPCSSRNHSTLLARLNSAPAISIPEVTSLGLVSSFSSCASSSTTTSTITTTAPMLIPLTVQSLNMSSSPNSTSQVIQPVTTVSSVLSGQIPIELCSSLPQSVNHTTTTSVTTVFTQPNVQSRLNHVIFGFQPLIPSSHQHPPSVAQTITKSLSSIVSGNASVSTSHNVISSHAEKSHVSEGSDASAPSHKLQSITSVVPNDVCHNESDSETQLSGASTSSARKCQQVSLANAEQEYLPPEKQATLHTITPAVVTSVSHCDISRSATINQGATKKKGEQENVGPSLQQRHNVSLPNLANENNQVKQPVIRISSASKTTLFNKQLTVDQNYAVSPETKMPFTSKQDAIERLLKYHVYNSKVPSYQEMATADQMFEKVSVQLLDKFRKMMNKYHLLQLKESLRPCPTPERVLLERLFQEDEKTTLERDKASAAEGKSLDLPPVPSHWLKDLNIPSSAQQGREDSVSPTKDDSDHLEAPVIDSCIDATSPPSDLGDRSPPTLKRIVVKTECSPDAEFEELCSKKRLKIQSTFLKSEANPSSWCTSNVKIEPKDEITSDESRTNPHKNFNRFHCDNRDDDIMGKLRNELTISPLENDENSGSVVPHGDFDGGCENGLPDFEPPVARTDSACDSTLMPAYSNCVRTSSEIKYDFDMLDCSSEWVNAYNSHTSHNTAESEAAVESILNDHHNPSELDLTGIEGLDDHLNDSQQSIPNGIREEGEESGDSELHYISYPIPKSRVLINEREGHSNDIQDQVQSAIKSILELQSDNRSYFGGDDSEIIPRLYELEKSHDSRKRCCVSPVSYVSLDGDIGVNSETDAALDEAVRSILQ